MGRIIMEITELSHKTNFNLISNLHKVTMLKDNKYYVYKNAYITIETIDPNCLSPCQYYILKDELSKKNELQEAFKKYSNKNFPKVRYGGRDIFSIDGYYEFRTSNEVESRTLLPPIVEESIELDGKIYPLINDGMHRIYLALLQKRKINVVYIRGALKPYYAYPLPNGWNDVKVVNEITKGSIKKIHRIQDKKKLYRNFDSVFTNCSKPRGITNNG